ncbi:MAG: tail fiber protein, partial [Saprospiraceae bacterium]|nr:tail fiber protein [Saprospiraceae bacterium]
NQALFSILGTTYGGDGRTTFALPDLRGRAAIHAGTGPGLTPRILGQRAGSETNILIENQLPSHNHGLTIPVSDEDPSADEPNGNVLAAGSFYTGSPAAGQFYGSGLVTGNTGANNPINNMQPFQVVNYIICLFGIFPSRN